MSDEKIPPAEPNPQPSNKPASEGGTFHQEVQHTQVSARVPDHVGRGVFSTGAIIMHGAHEFVMDFLCNLAPPHRVSSRVVLPHSVVPLLVGALQENLAKYQQHFGAVPRMPAPPPGTQPPPIDEIYANLKLPDEQLSGIYANTVMISHSPAEFCFDFITSFYPRSAVAARIFLATPHVPQFLESLSRSWEQFRRKREEAAAQRNRDNPPPPAPPAPPAPPGSAEPSGN